jgi:hypothetical protein
MKAFTDVGKVRRLGTVKRLNEKTVLLKIMKGAKTSFTIKRHIEKHDVWFIGVDGTHYQPLNTRCRRYRYASV